MRPCPAAADNCRSYGQAAGPPAPAAPRRTPPRPPSPRPLFAGGVP
jgi:hypothetical protein